MERPFCWSRAAWGAGVATEVDGASSHPALHTALAATVEAPLGRCSHPHWTDVAAGTPGAEMGKERKENIYIQHID